MPNLTASIPHQLTRAEAKRRIQEHLGVLRHQHGSMFTNVQETWTGDAMSFSVTAMGQSVAGNLNVDDQAIHITVVLPWLLSMLSGSIKQQLEVQGKRLLELPPPR
jgi:putative polyhydroxyalkanoate system protein